jgi:Domain of unknown function (DUF4279)
MHTYSVQFRISGKDLNPDEVTHRLGLEPNQVRIAGERRSESQVWNESLWSYGDTASAEAAREWTSLEDGLRYVLERLLPKKELIQEYTKSHETVSALLYALPKGGHARTGTFDGIRRKEKTSPPQA